MNRFWNSIILPIIQGVNAKYIVEIGSDTGLNTEKILEYCIDNDAHMVAMDPFPQFDVEEFKSKYGNKFKIYKDLSLNKLPILKDYDVILIDGDHNWYTVYNELKIIEKTFKDKNFPLVFLHDVGWPYGRRDLYYNPEDIPTNYRQPYKKLGIYPGKENLEKDGINSSLYNAIYENNPKNGVLTAVEDFIKESNLDFSFEVINAFNGLGILFPKNQEIESIVKNTIIKSNLFKKIEDERIKFMIERSKLKDQNNENKTRLSFVQKQLKESNELVKERENRLFNMEKNVEELESEIESLLKMEYLKNINRTIFQRLISKFNSIYILFKHKSNIKLAFINIKGYRAIQKNDLLDIGYYLKNNVDVRESGMDPILHYIYDGFKEKRKPSSQFNSNYYLKVYDDVKKTNLNPLIHYALYGLKEGRKTHENSETKSNQILKKNNMRKKTSDRDPYVNHNSGKLSKVLKFIKYLKKNKNSNEEFFVELENKFKVSIIMPTYNRKYIIKRAINSILNQGFSNYELIICDDGSTDGTEELLKKDYSHYFKSGQFIYLKQENKGVSKARNMCLENSNGDLIAYLDTDNYWEPEFLKKMVSLFHNNPKFDSAYAALHIHNLVENKHYILNHHYDRNKLLKENFIDLNVFMHRRKLYELLGGFNESLKRLVDWDLILKYTKNNEPLSLGEVLAHYYIEENFKNISLQEGFEENRDKIYNIYSNEIIERMVSNSNFITDPFITLLYLKSKRPFYKKNYLKVAVFIEGELKTLKSCPYIRLYAPLEYLSSKDNFKIFIYGREDFAEVDISNIMKSKLFDVIIIQRGAMDIETSEIILKKCKDNNIKVIYELDDDLLSINANNRNYSFFQKQRIAMEYLIKNSDTVTVTTNELSKRFNNMNKTLIVRNYLVNELKPMQKNKTKNNVNSINIGYYGTLTHDDDLLMIKEPICNVINKFKEDYDINVNFHIIGGMNNKQDESWFTKIEIPKDSTDFVSFMKWVKDNVKFDIMVAPLMDTVFNNAKSELKYIEYTALGMPGIYSDLPPYNSIIQDGVNGLLAKNRSDWELKLEKLILDHELRIKIVENAQKNIQEDYLLEQRAEEWKNILQNITQTKKSKIKISIILPVYNMEKYLRNTLESIERQTIGLENLEVLMINEASEDGSRLIMDEYAEKYENFIAVHLSKSSGTPGKPRNIGIEMANGDYLMFIDHDDYYTDDACEVLYNKISQEGADIVSGIYNFVHGHEIKKLYDISIFENDNEINVKNISEKEELLTLSPVVWSKIFRRNFIIKNNLRFPVGVLAEDLIFLSEALLKAKGIIFLNYPIYNYRVLDKKGEKSLSQSRHKKWFKGVCDARKTIWDTYQKEDKEEFFKPICEYSLSYILNVFAKSDMEFNDKLEVLEYIYWIIEKSYIYGIMPPKRYENLYNSIIEKDFEGAIRISENIDN